MYSLFRPGPLGSAGRRGLWCSKRCLSVLRQNFYEGDSVWIRPVGGGKPHWRALESKTQSIYIAKDAVRMEDIVGRASGDLVRTLNDRLVRLEAPSLAEYIRYTERLVTPIYPCDASDIVSLLDLHVCPLDEPSRGRPELEILEAGTGHGGLTLHLAQRIQAANPPLTAPVLYEARQEKKADPSLRLDALRSYKARRNAVLHTVDTRQDVSEHARKVIGGFRGALYAPHIDMHVADVQNWLSTRLGSQEVDENGEKKPFLRHVLLDLPDADQHVELAQQALHPGGTMLIFSPSISQIEHLVTVVHNKKLPLILDRVVELSSTSSGGRDWDVRIAKIRSSLKKPGSSAEESASDAIESEDSSHEEPLGADPQSDLDADTAAIDPADGEVRERASERELTSREIRTPSFVSVSGETRQAMVVRPKPSPNMSRCAFVAVLRRSYPEELQNPLPREGWYGSAGREQKKRTKKLVRRQS